MIEFRHAFRQYFRRTENQNLCIEKHYAILTNPNSTLEQIYEIESITQLLVHRTSRKTTQTMSGGTSPNVRRANLGRKAYGWLEGDGVRCCYHGWKFNTDTGKCSEIPFLTEHHTLDLDRIQVLAYPCREAQGNIWVYFSAQPRAELTPENLPPLPLIPDFGQAEANISETVHFPCHIDHAVVGLMDPAHGLYVHTSWWWRSGSRRFRVKEKQYEPVKILSIFF